MNQPMRPGFRDLDRDACERLLARNHVARLAFAFHDRVDIEPIHYVYEGDWLYARTSPGSKLATLAHNRWVAVEVDEIDGLFDWRSVVAHGTFVPLDPDVPGPQADSWLKAITMLRELVPGTATAEDPAPFRRVVFGIHLDTMTGRAAATGAGTRAPERQR